MAAIGEVREARRDGRYADTRVTPTPTTYARTTVVVVSVSALLLISRPNDEKSEASPRASPSPSRMPSVAPSSAMSAASTSTERRTCFVLAPSARSSASSRTRCATRMLNVLAMMKPPTRMAITANAMRNWVITSVNSAIADSCSSATVSPSTAS